MVADSKNDFAERLKRACLHAYPPISEGRGRRAELRRRVVAAQSKLMGAAPLKEITGESVRKWLDGLSIPSMDNVRFLAYALHVEVDWLLTGREKTKEVKQDRAGYDPTLLDEQTKQVIAILKTFTPAQRENVLAFAKGIAATINDNKPAIDIPSKRTGT